MHLQKGQKLCKQVFEKQQNFCNTLFTALKKNWKYELMPYNVFVSMDETAIQFEGSLRALYV